MHLLSVCLLVGECSCLCFYLVTECYNLCWVVYPFPRAIKKKVCFFLFIHYVQAQLITMNKNMKNMTNSLDVYNKDADQTVQLHNLMPVLIQPAHGVGPLSACQQNGI